MISGSLRSRDGSSGVDSLDIRRTSSALERMRGLLGKGPLNEGQGLWIAPCNSIHTWFMSFAIDAVFLDSGGKVVKICAEIKPWRLAACLKAASVLEISAGASVALGIREGQVYQWVENDDK